MQTTVTDAPRFPTSTPLPPPAIEVPPRASDPPPTSPPTWAERWLGVAGPSSWAMEGQRLLLAIALAELILEKPDDSLGRGEASFHGAMLLNVIIFRRVRREEDDNARFETAQKLDESPLTPLAFYQR